MIEFYDDFKSPQCQWALLQHGSRSELIAWLTWNDPGGIWNDEDSLAAGMRPMSTFQALAAMRKALSDNRILASLTCRDFDPKLPDNANNETCRLWLRQVCRTFGLGFHLDTPASEYLGDDGIALPSDVIKSLDESVDRAFALLGDELPYLVCIREFEAMILDLPEQ